MPLSTATDLQDTEGPNASLQFGDATRMSALQREAGTLALGGAARSAPTSPSPQPGGPPAAGPPPAPSAPPVQPPAQAMHAGPVDLSKVFTPPRVGAPQPDSWREELQYLAQHPNAGPALRSLLALIKQR